MVFCPTQEMRDRMASSMGDLMASDPDWREEASQIMEMLDSADIFVLPEGKTPRAWCQSLFQHSAFSGLAETAIEREMVPEETGRPLDQQRPAERLSRLDLDPPDRPFLVALAHSDSAELCAKLSRQDPIRVCRGEQHYWGQKVTCGFSGYFPVSCLGDRC
jgi:hypothetical protein